MSDNCLFCKIAAGEIPSDKLYEDDDVLAFWDISPQAPTHFLIIPKKHLTGMSDVSAEDEALIGKILRIGAELAKEQGVEHYRLISNCGSDAGQIIFHLHFHIMGGRKMKGMG